MAGNASQICGVSTWVRSSLYKSVAVADATADNLTWSQVKLSTSYRRLSHTATQVGSYLFVWGGHDGTSYTSELLLFNLGKSPYASQRRSCIH